jgi:hypothetical protein
MNITTVSITESIFFSSLCTFKIMFIHVCPHYVKKTYIVIITKNYDSWISIKYTKSVPYALCINEVWHFPFTEHSLAILVTCLYLMCTGGYVVINLNFFSWVLVFHTISASTVSSPSYLENVQNEIKIKIKICHILSEEHCSELLQSKISLILSVSSWEDLESENCGGF